MAFAITATALTWCLRQVEEILVEGGEPIVHMSVVCKIMGLGVISEGMVGLSPGTLQSAELVRVESLCRRLAEKKAAEAWKMHVLSAGQRGVCPLRRWCDGQHGCGNGGRCGNVGRLLLVGCQW